MLNNIGDVALFDFDDFATRGDKKSVSIEHGSFSETD
jgi:hypothetical protein